MSPAARTARCIGSIAEMTAADLIAILQTVPPTAKVFYRDMNFGGPADEFTQHNIDTQDGQVLIESQYWEPCD